MFGFLIPKAYPLFSFLILLIKTIQRTNKSTFSHLIRSTFNKCFDFIHMDHTLLIIIFLIYTFLLSFDETNKLKNFVRFNANHEFN